MHVQISKGTAKEQELLSPAAKWALGEVQEIEDAVERGAHHDEGWGHCPPGARSGGSGIRTFGEWVRVEDMGENCEGDQKRGEYTCN